MGKYHSELLMLFNLAFLMKCKYESLSVRLFEITVTGLRNTLYKTRLLVCIYFFTLSRMTEDLEEMYNLNVYIKCC